MKIFYPLDMPVLKASDNVPFALFSSQHLISVDGFTTTDNLVNYIDSTRLEKYATLFKNQSAKIYQNGREIIITFIATEQELKKANGFFDYGEKDKGYVKGKFWFNVTRLTLP